MSTSRGITTTAALTITAAVTTAGSLTSTGAGEGLSLIIEQAPPFAWQGQEISLIFTVTNRLGAVAQNVELRNEVPAQLRFLAAEVPTGATLAEEEITPDGLAFVVTWPTLAPGASSTVTVRLQINADLPDGAVVDDLAVVSANGVEPLTAGVSIGMPPTALPDFQ
ncbi:MAG TPA: hypothetical protein PKE45_07325 [Caldilineaceae bacterium]|nr:hypothetical protein [Caldilineaceae bacterium]